mmetsp:Transcript_1275/g.2520  ORF Transcript_1275/g.2520 Transcript_1275/m.2520 type:complete len:288 (-) Transcript_1275:202-1065(-)
MEEGNNLTGPIPTEMCSMERIEVVLLAHNGIGGTIPSQIQNTAGTMKELLLSHNTLRGTIPPAIGKLTRLQTLRLDSNHFSGSIPQQVGSMTSLSSIDLRRNHLDGTIPTELGLLTNLIEIRLEGNFFTGTIPTEIAWMEQLQVLTFDQGYGLNKSLLAGYEYIPGNIKTLAPCRVCDDEGKGTQPKLKPEHTNNGNGNDQDIFFENNGLPGGETEGFSCRSLLETKLDDTKFMSANACEALRTICTTVCGDNENENGDTKPNGNAGYNGYGVDSTQTMVHRSIDHQ